MAAFDQRFLLSRADTGFAGSLVGKALGLSAKAMQFPADRSLGRQPERRTRLAYVCPLMRHRVRRGVEDAGRDDKGNAYLSPSASWPIRASPVRLARCGRGRGGGRGYGVAVCSLPLHRQLGQVIGRASRKRWLFRAKCPPPPSPASAIVTEGEDPKGLRESPQAANRARPVERRPKPPSQESNHSKATERRRHVNGPDRRWRDRPASPTRSSRRIYRQRCKRFAARFRRERPRA